jgi:hypothetical protein
MPPDDWVAVAALAQVATAGIAIWAVRYARGQVQAARDTAERVAQPEVVVFIDHNPVDWHHMDLVIKNFGQTAAYNVRVTLPPLQIVPFDNEATGERVTTHYVPSTIAVLAPGQEWRSAWESGIDMEDYDGELPSNYVGTVDFDDKMNATKPGLSNPISLDINMFRNTHRISIEKGKTVEKALYEISGTLKGFKSQHSGVWVYTVPADEERSYYQQIKDAIAARRKR